MNILSGTLFFLGLVAGGSTQENAADQTMSRVSRSAEQELSKSIQGLTELRQQISNEKLPLAQELTSLEEQLTQLRRDHDKVTRLVDAGNLEISTIQSKLKDDEVALTYIGNLLDEYARNFESKVHVSELQYCGEAIESAKQASSNTSLSLGERFARQTTLVAMTVSRLFDAIGGMRFAGVGVDLHGAVAQGQFAIIGPVALFRGDGGGATGLVVPQTGSTNPLIRPLEGDLQAGIAALVDTGDGLLPLDPSRGGALKALVQRTNIFHVFEKGGPIMWPLLIASILALGTVIERLFFLMGEKLKRDRAAQDRFFTAVTQGDTEGAIRIGKASKFYVVRAMSYALTHKEQSLASLT